ncbi:MAG: hypothetical protein AAGC95_12320, partial [Pseudomonadota bacterium]
GLYLFYIIKGMFVFLLFVARGTLHFPRFTEHVFSIGLSIPFCVFLIEGFFVSKSFDGFITFLFLFPAGFVAFLVLSFSLLGEFRGEVFGGRLFLFTCLVLMELGMWLPSSLMDW